MICTQIIAAPSKRIAVSYDPEKDELVYQRCEIIGLIQLEDPESVDVQQVPCYLYSNDFGLFWVPELEYNFLKYVDERHSSVIDIADFQPQIEEIKRVFNSAQTEVVEIETRGKISTIKRSIKKLKDEPNQD